MIRSEYLKNITQLLRGTILKSSVIKDSQKRQKKPIYCLSSSNIDIDKNIEIVTIQKIQQIQLVD